MTAPDLTPLEQQAVDLLLQSICAEDDDLARALARQAAEALADVALANGGKRLELASSLLDMAGHHLDLAEAESDPQERQRQLHLFERYMAAAEEAKSTKRPGPQIH